MVAQGQLTTEMHAVLARFPRLPISVTRSPSMSLRDAAVLTEAAAGRVRLLTDLHDDLTDFPSRDMHAQRAADLQTLVSTVQPDLVLRTRGNPVTQAIRSALKQSYPDVRAFFDSGLVPVVYDVQGDPDTGAHATCS